MLIRDLPYADPGVPDVRSGPRLLLWLGRRQLRGQAKSLAWGTLHMASVASIPVAVGLAVQAVVDRSGERLALAAALLALIGVGATVGDTMLHRTAVSNWITAAARVQQLLARRTSALGATLTQRVAAGEVVAVSTGDIEKIGWCVESVSRFSAGVLVALCVCAGLIAYEPELGLLVAAGLLLLIAVVLPMLPRATRRADLQREKAGRATELAADTVAGLRVLRGIGGEELFLERYRGASQEVRRAAVRTARMWALIEAVQVALPGLLLIAVVWHGTGLAMDGRISVGELTTVYGAVTFLLFPLRLVQEFAMAYSFSRPSAARAARVLGLRRAVEGRGDGGAALVDPVAGDLHDPVAGLLAPAGRLTAVVCGDPDEAGRLAARLGGHDAGVEDGGSSGDGDGGDGNGGGGGDGAAVVRGSGAGTGRAGRGGTDAPGTARPAPPSVLLGGVPLDDVTLARARAAVLVQDKDPVLLSGTLRELLDVPASGRVPAHEALAAAQCGDVLDALRQGTPGLDGDPLEARVTERGRSLSGGQRQRLALARSLVTDPPVLVLDEPTSAVDSHTEARIADALRHVRAGRTTVVLTSSPLLLDRADHVVLVRDGRVAASGSHRELLGADPRYRAVVTRETDDELAEGTTHA
ncbi:ABC transporter transmembrane domain-containing protein [Streptomyces phytohabitans]|uniref:ABC transporter transmembrane domain-containing protein n=1 Tax=Streptomyces phytohabitans TaxID=1150371 RepID=UPI00345B794C